MRQPIVMQYLRRRWRRCWIICVNDQGWTVDYMSSYPVGLKLSLEKRMVPRISVFSLLLLKSMVKKSSVGPTLQMSEPQFREQFQGVGVECDSKMVTLLACHLCGLRSCRVNWKI
ncbi:uncharacterized protein LOC116200189 [Punica granatum]|uniref:Uncharacterized protein LOC116200189 n=1 Tax=Punica granatum TaxID=22663 RepID=A0A6P8CXP9_PUNGR|nr:uncharacterized protein LOC116200189 [Punica granatum]